MPYYNNPMAAYPGGYGMPGGYGQSPYFGGGVQTQAPQRYEIVHVAGEAGIWALKMAPNSGVIAMDDNAPMVWLAQTDAACNKTVQGFDISPHHPAPAVDVSSLDTRLSRLEELLNGTKSDDGLSAAPAKRQAAAK